MGAKLCISLSVAIFDIEGRVLGLLRSLILVLETASASFSNISVRHYA